MPKWHLKGFTDAVYFDDGDRQIQVLDANGPVTTGISCERIAGQPDLVFWGYTVVNEKAMYNPSASKDFGLDSAEQSDVVIKVLKLAGVSIEAPQIAQAASMEEELNLQHPLLVQFMERFLVHPFQQTQQLM